MDRSLATLLRSFQTSSSIEDAFRLLPSATGLLARLSNPLNVTLLSSHILENEALYPEPVSVVQARQIFSLFYTASLRFGEDHRDEKQQHVRSNLSETEWTTAVIKGAGESSPRWRHMLMIGALLLAQHNQHEELLPTTLHQNLENALVTACNYALVQAQDTPNSQFAVAFVLSHTFTLLSNTQFAQLNHNLLLPVLIDAAFFARDGLEQGYWLSSVDQDIRQMNSQMFSWSSRSYSFTKVQEIKSRPFVSALGALSRLFSLSVEHVQDRRVIVSSVDRIAGFTRNVALSWRQNKLSEIDTAEESQYLDQETIGTTLPVLLQILRDSMFATIFILRSVLGRTLCDSVLASNQNAPHLSIQTLHILRDMFFISHRFGQTSSSQYVFVNFTSLDILNQYPLQSESFLSSIRPPHAGSISPHPLDRNLDLFFLNTAEHFTLSISPVVNEQLLNIASPYVHHIHSHPRLSEICESGHSLYLSVFAAPQNASIIQRHVPQYIETLLASFPGMLDPRQFRLAIKSIMKVAAPPSSIAITMPMIQAIILDLLVQRFDTASETNLTTNTPSITPQPANAHFQPPISLPSIDSEKSVLLLSIIDSLPFLSPDLLDEYLSLTTDLLHALSNPAQRDTCTKRFWEVLSNGEMDVERAARCVRWWNMRGGRERTLFGEVPEELDGDGVDGYSMSGGLSESKL